MPTFGSLFAGIGGIDLGLERAGWECRFQVEWDPFCQRVLAKHWPDIPRYGDITAVDWSGVERVDLLAGGFPCQPISGAGHGKAQDDARWLWPEFLRAIRDLRPRYVLVENVTNLLAINGGSAFGEVVGGLAESGYDAEWDCIPASAVGALHERDRVWIVAYAAGNRRSFSDGADIGRIDPSAAPLRLRAEPVRDGPGPRALADSDRVDGEGLQPQCHDEKDGSQPAQRPLGLFGGAWPDREWPAEPDVGRVAHGVPNRVDRLRSLGNAVVPQVVEVIGTQLLQAIESAA